MVAAAVTGLRDRFEVVAGLFAGGREKLRAADVPGAAAATSSPGSGPTADPAAAIDPGSAGDPGPAAGPGSAAEPSAAGLAGLASEVGLPRLDAFDPRADPVHVTLRTARAALRTARADVLVDLSDEPVVGYRERFLIMSAALAEGARYLAADTEVRPQEFVRLTGAPALGVIGTGKRVGKTAVSGWLARRLDAALRADGGVIVVAMGRGGPPEPELIDGEGLGVAELLAVSRAGRHAASDSYEDAALSGVAAIGCRRCGGGLAGAPFDDNVRAAVPLVEARGAALAVVEGSGAVVPPIMADATLCIAGAGQPPEYVSGYLGTYRLLISDALILTQCEPPFAGPADVAALTAAVRAVKPGIDVVPTVFRPRPAQPIGGRKVAFFTTAPKGAAPRLERALAEDHGADVVLVSCDLADRGRLREAVARAAARADVFLTEIKAAAIDVVAEAAAAAGRELVFCDNEPVALDGDLEATVRRLAALAGERFSARRERDAGMGSGADRTGTDRTGTDRTGPGS